MRFLNPFLCTRCFLLNLYGEMLDLWDKYKLYMEDRA